jgi:uncharacterized membrane protein YczE
MGAPIGLGTVVFVITLGPIMSFWFRVLRVSVGRIGQPAQPETRSEPDLASR